MVAWHRSRRADLGLRVVGLLVCGVSYLAIRQLIALHISPQSAGVTAYALAATGFLCGSAGSAMLLLGGHLFDEVEVSARWRTKPAPSRTIFSEDMIMNTTEPALLVVGRDADGSWTVRESAGMLLGRFGSADAAQRFARAERGGRPAVSIATSAGAPARIAGRLTLRTDRDAATGTTGG